MVKVQTPSAINRAPAIRFLTTREIDGIGIHAFPIDACVSPNPLLKRPVGQGDALISYKQTCFHAGRVPVRVRVLYHHSLNVGSAHPPQTQGKVQSAVSLALSGMYRLQTEALIGLMERQTTSKVPEELILPIIEGFDRW